MERANCVVESRGSGYSPQMGLFFHLQCNPWTKKKKSHTNPHTNTQSPSSVHPLPHPTVPLVFSPPQTVQKTIKTWRPRPVQEENWFWNGIWLIDWLGILKMSRDWQVDCLIAWLILSMRINSSYGLIGWLTDLTPAVWSIDWLIDTGFVHFFKKNLYPYSYLLAPVTLRLLSLRTRTWKTLQPEVQWGKIPSPRALTVPSWSQSQSSRPRLAHS